MNLYNFDGDQWFKIYKCLTNKARGAYTYSYDWVLSTISNIFRKNLARIHIYGILELSSFFYPEKTLDVRFYTAAIVLIKIAHRRTRFIPIRPTSNSRRPSASAHHQIPPHPFSNEKKTAFPLPQSRRLPPVPDTVVRRSAAAPCARAPGTLASLGSGGPMVLHQASACTGTAQAPGLSRSPTAARSPSGAWPAAARRHPSAAACWRPTSLP